MLFAILLHCLYRSSYEEKIEYPSFQEVVLENNNYNRLISPFEKTRQRMDIYVSVPFAILVSVDESRQIVSYIAAVNVTWYDDRLKFDPNDLGYNSAIVPSTLLWLPPLEAFNSVELKFINRETPSNDVMVQYTGWSSMLIKGKFDTICRFDVSGFPFDTQTCMLDFVLGLHDSTQAIFHPGWPSDLIMWNIYPPVIKTTILKTRGGNFYSIALAAFKLVRNPQFYVYMLILPTMIVTTTCLGGLLLPLKIDDGEKWNIGIAGMLGQTFILSVVVVQVPRATNLPLMAKWQIFQLFYCIVAMIWEFPLRFLKYVLIRRYARSKRWESLIPKILAGSSAFLFIGSDLLMTILWFNYPPDSNQNRDTFSFMIRFILFSILQLNVLSFSEPEYPIFSHLILQNKSYDRLVSPYEINRKTMIVNISFPLVILVSVDETRQLVSYIASITLLWNDPRLRFDPNDMGYESVIIPSMLIWIPPVEAYNAVELKFLERETPSNLVQVFNNGNVLMASRGKYDTVCRCDAFPFDSSSCSISFETGLYNMSQLMFHSGNQTLQMLIGLPEWNITSTTLIDNYTYANGPIYTLAVASFELKRNPQFYVLSLIVPTILVTITCLATILLPIGIGEGEKANIALAGLSALTFMLSIVVVQVPRSTKVPLLAIWLLIQMFYCLFAIAWEIPLTFLKKWIIKWYATTKRRKELIPWGLSVASAMLFIISNIVMTSVLFTTSPSHAPPTSDYML